jgi:catechol 2,3-dioxygenase-like lactoylglutathione lyase family enzyme
MNEYGLASIRHVDLCVSDLERSLDFYCNVLGHLGWDIAEPHREIAGEQGERVIYLSGPGGYHQGALGLRAARQHKSVDRYQVGLHHIAFNAKDEASVDAVWKWISQNDIEHEGAPRNYYDIPYYAVFFRDGDGIKIEVVHCSVESTAAK